MAAKKGKGLFLAWADVPASMEQDFNKWYNEEHMAELLAIPGVLSAARYVAVSGSPKYLAAYELENPEVRDTPGYQEHLIKPTEWSKRVNLQARATRMVANNYRLLFPLTVTRKVAASDMAPVLQIGRMSIPRDQEDEFNTFYNTIYAPNYEKVPGCIRFRRYALYKGQGPMYGVVYEFENEKVSQTPEWLAARKKSGGALGDKFPRMAHDAGSPGIYKKIFQL
jgi:hypothetical protein